MTFVLFIVTQMNLTTLEYPSDAACRQARSDVLAHLQSNGVDATAFCISGMKHEAQK